jgi:hypothetical protein
VSDDGFGVQFALHGELTRRKHDDDGRSIHVTVNIVREAERPVNSFPA